MAKARFTGKVAEIAVLRVIALRQAPRVYVLRSWNVCAESTVEGRTQSTRSTKTIISNILFRTPCDFKHKGEFCPLDKLTRGKRATHLMEIHLAFGPTACVSGSFVL